MEDGVAPPTLRVRDALDLVGEFVGAKLSVSNYLRYVLPSEHGGPGRFPFDTRC